MTVILLFSILHNFFFKESGNLRGNHISLLKPFRKESRLKNSGGERKRINLMIFPFCITFPLGTYAKAASVYERHSGVLSLLHIVAADQNK
jgi:hypothetical protein